VRGTGRDAVEEGEFLFFVESMKMHFEVTAPRSGCVAS
jgi:biotin carboxyl carrier protein